MTQATLSKLWSASALLLLYFSINAWSLTQQWQLSLPGDPFREGKFTPHGVTLVAIPLGGTLLALTALLARLHALRSAGGDWTHRLPRFGDFKIDVSRREGKVFQAASLGGFVLLPAAAQVHFLLKFLDGAPYFGLTALSSGFAHLVNYVPLADALSGRYSYDRTEGIAPSFAPFWQPWLYVLLEAFVLSTVIICVWAMFRRAMPRRRQRPLGVRPRSGHGGGSGSRVSGVDLTGQRPSALALG